MSEEPNIYLCYCSENLPEACNYCKAKGAIREILRFPPREAGEDAINRIFEEFHIAPKTRLEMLFELEGKDNDSWFST